MLLGPSIETVNENKLDREITNINFLEDDIKKKCHPKINF